MPKGFRHTEEVRKKMSSSRTGQTFSLEHRAAISASLKGRIAEKKYHRVCACGSAFSSGAWNARFCSRRCNRAARGHGLKHAPEFAHFPKLCAICAATADLVGDHEHRTGRPRGLLCRNCNLAIGNMFDDPSRLRAAAAYLEK